MISEELLCRAAARSSACYAAGLAQGYDPAEAHVFSPAFEQRMARLCRRAEHPALYTGLQRAAAILLAALIAGTAWLAVDVNAREQFAGWLREVRENAISYRGVGNGKAAPESSDYKLNWIPEGYEFWQEYQSGTTKTIGYIDDKGKLMWFVYTYQQGEQVTAIDSEGAVSYPCDVSGYAGELILFDDPSVANNIVWQDRDGRLFHISGFLSEEDLLKVASSIYEK